MKYIITIFERVTSTTNLLNKTEDNINETIDKELGGWNNLHACSNSGVKHDLLSKDEYFMAGTTKDNLKCFSIICVNE
jgi:hypothetical protein